MKWLILLAAAVQASTPVYVDAHNDVLSELRRSNWPSLADDLTPLKIKSDLVRWRANNVKLTFWALVTPCPASDLSRVEYAAHIGAQAQLTQETLVMARQVARTAGIELIYSAKDALKGDKTQAVLAIEGGHLLGLDGVVSYGARGYRLDVLEMLKAYYYLGARYLTLAHFCDSPLATSEQSPNQNTVGLTETGKKAIALMNDLGMMVDLSHASHQTMRDVLQITKSPVLFSHSNAYSVCNNTRNVPDDVLDMVKANGGAVCVNFVSFFVCQSHYNAWVANGATNNNRKPYNDWFARHNSTDTPCTIKDVVPHIKYLATKLGIDHVCIGPDFPAVMNAIDNVGDLHLLTTELDKEFSPQDVDKITSRNIVRVWGAVEQRQTSIR